MEFEKDINGIKGLVVITPKVFGDERGFFKTGKKKNFITWSMVDTKGLDFYGMPR